MDWKEGEERGGAGLRERGVAHGSRVRGEVETKEVLCLSGKKGQAGERVRGKRVLQVGGQSKEDNVGTKRDEDCVVAQPNGRAFIAVIIARAEAEVGEAQDVYEEA